MPTVGTSSKPAYVYDAGTDTWIPIGPGEHTHAYIPNTLTTTTGDIIYASGANTPARLGIGSSGNVLTVSGGVPVWSAPAGGGKVLQVVQSTYSTATTIASTTMTDTGLSGTITPSSTSSKILIMTNQVVHYKRSANQLYVSGQLLRDATVIHDKKEYNYIASNAFSSSNPFEIYCQFTLCYLDSPSSTSALTYKTQGKIQTTADSGTSIYQQASSPSTMILMEIGA
jgi:hypothetical protein